VGPREAPAEDAVLEEVSSRLHDGRRFLEAYLGFRALLDGLLAQRLDTPATRDDGCWLACLRCFGTLLGFVGSSIGLVTACGGALVTGGSTLIICVGAFIAHETVMIAALTACASCNACASKTQRKKKDCCECRGEPLCDCPPDCPSDGP
jgi:hypothetical protein